MAISKYAKINLEFAKKQLEEWKAYLEAHPFDTMEDRIKLKETKNGGVIPVPIATIEAQQKNCRDMLREYVALTAEVEKQLAEAPEKDTSTYGNVGASPRMKKHESRKDEDEE